IVNGAMESSEHRDGVTIQSGCLVAPTKLLEDGSKRGFVGRNVGVVRPFEATPRMDGAACVNDGAAVAASRMVEASEVVKERGSKVAGMRVATSCQGFDELERAVVERFGVLEARHEFVDDTARIQEAGKAGVAGRKPAFSTPLRTKKHLLGSPIATGVAQE